MAGKFDNTREKTEKPEDMSEFDLDTELAGLTSFLQEMGVDLEDETSAGDETTVGDEAPVGDEITGSIFFDFAEKGDTVSEDVLEHLLFGEGGMEETGSQNAISGKAAGSAGESDDAESLESLLGIKSEKNAAEAHDAGNVPATHRDDRVTNGKATAYDAGGAKGTAGAYDVGGAKGMSGACDAGDVNGMSGAYDAGDADGTSAAYDMGGVNVASDTSDIFGETDTDAVYDMSDVSHAVDSYDMDDEDDRDDMYHWDGLPDEDDAYDIGSADDIHDAYDIGSADDVHDAYGIGNADDVGDAHYAGAAEDADDSDDSDRAKADAKSSKKVEKEVDKVLRKTFGRPFSWKREVISWAAMFIFAFTLAFVIDNFLIVNATVPTGSMQNTIMAGDRMIGWRLSYLFSDPERGDVIIFEYPDDPEEIYVKRIIGLPGETVTITDGEIYINDSTEPLEEDYLPEEWVWKNDGFTFVVPEDSYLCLGDNRNNSHDARSWTNTYVTKDAILGQAILIYWPTEDFCWLN